MTINHTTFLLNLNTWDLCLDSLGNIAIASAPYSIAQDVATQISTFLGECWYDTTQGVPYWQQILGARPAASLIIAAIQEQALLVPDVATCEVTLESINAQRGITGQVVITDTDGNTTSLSLNGASIRVISTQSGSPVTSGGNYLEV